jgi:hypothetical protein
MKKMSPTAPELKVILPFTAVALELRLGLRVKLAVAMLFGVIKIWYTYESPVSTTPLAVVVSTVIIACRTLPTLNTFLSVTVTAIFPPRKEFFDR